VTLLPKLLIATNNRGKVGEYRYLLDDLAGELLTPADLGIHTEVMETGDTLEDNASLKAVALALESKLITLADDSGLEVDILGGEPGPFSARYAGEDASDEDRISYLLSRMNGVPWTMRTARFVCVIALSTPEGKVEFCYGECPGLITLEPRGKKGFGYDPVFYLPELDKTMAELPMEVKNRISHRGVAARQVKDALNRLIGNG